jgi:molybdate/tungstate transport system permease protein
MPGLMSKSAWIKIFIFPLLFAGILFFTKYDTGTRLVLAGTLLTCLLIFFFTSVRARIKQVFSLLLLFYFLIYRANEPQLFSCFALLLTGSAFNASLFGVMLILVLSAVLAPFYWLLFTLFGCSVFLLIKELKTKKADFFKKSMLIMGLLFLGASLFPVFNMVTSTSAQSLALVFESPAFRQALKVSLASSTVSALITLVFGVPLAYGLARIDFKGKNIIDSFVDLPILIPHSVAGIAILSSFGPKSPIGAFLIGNFGISVASAWPGIIMAQVFVSSPFLIRSAIAAFEDMGSEYEKAARTLGAGPARAFFTISLPLAVPALVNGFLLTWARAMSEVAAIMIVASEPKTLSIYIYDEFLSMGILEARPPAVLMVIICVWAFFCVRWFKWRYYRREGDRL